MVHKHGKHFRLDRVVPGIGRIAMSSGTDRPSMFGRINAAITGAAMVGALDALAGLRDRVYSPIVFTLHYERGQLAKLPTAQSARPLVATLEAWMATHEVAESTRADIGTAVRHIAAQATKGASVDALPGVVRELREQMADRPVAFNRLRAYMLAFARVTYGKNSPIYRGVEDVERFKKAEGKRPRTLIRRALTVAELDQVCAAFTDHTYKAGRGTRRILAKHLRLMTLTLATTGMRPQEYWEREGAYWTDRSQHAAVPHIWVHGTKTTAAVRPTLYIGHPCAAACGEQFFRRAFAAVTTKVLREALDAYSLRYTFQSWCEEAGIIESRRKAYHGHGPKTVTDLYLRTNVLPYVAEDAERVRQWIASERERAKGLTLVKASQK